MFQRLDNLIRLIDQAIRLFGAGLLEYPALLQAFERFEERIVSEHGRWEQLWEQYRARGRERHEAITHTFSSTRPGAPELPEIPLAPHETLVNLIVLVAFTLDIVVAITLIFKDWENMPSERDAEGQRVIYGWRYINNAYKPPWVPK